MFDPARVLQPLADAEPAIRGLHEYADPAEMAESVVRVRAAVERVLRLLLRYDTSAPDALRLHALSPAELPLEQVTQQLRTSDLLTLELAGLTHDLVRAADRARTGDVRAADADLALRVVDVLRAHVLELADRPKVQTDTTVESREALPQVEPDSSYARQRRARQVAQRRAVLGATAVVTSVVVVMIALIVLTRRDDSVANGIAAFEQGRLTVAEAHFREAVERDPDNVTAQLYLARIFRRGERRDEAASILQDAVRTAPDDPGVRRELGYLFLDLNRPEPAAEQFRRALAVDPENTANWVGLIRSLRDAGDPSADDLLERAPADVRARFVAPG
ncbi:MAG TPA: tetratricopeptide repeat protein [Longimicrobiales bacterium]|nr:tetratricopeptide repeat protein [Longimicrobiales bacterium]